MSKNAFLLSRHFRYVVYKIIFPNGKVYIGKDVGKGGHTIRYFGSWDNALVEKDFTKAELLHWTLTREILFESDDKNEVSKKETEFIRAFQSNNLEYGYNQTHRSRVKSAL